MDEPTPVDVAPDEASSGNRGRLDRALAGVALGVIVACIVVLANGYHRVGHPQGDDFALYLRQAKSIFDGNIAQVVADNRFTAVFSGKDPFTPYAYPWGFPLLLSPFVNRWGLDYDRLKWITVGCLAVWAILVHGVVRRRVGRIAALAVLAGVFTAPAILKHTDSLLSEFPHAMAVGLMLWWFDRVHRRHGWLLDAPVRSLVGLGALGAAAFNFRRESIVLFVAILAVQLGEIACGRWRTLRHRPMLHRLVAPHAGFFGTAVLAQLLLPSMLFPKNADKPSFIDNRLADYRGVLTDQLGLEQHKWVGLVILLVALLGAVLGIRRRPHLDGFLFAVALFSLLAVSTHFRMVGRYYLQVLPWVVYFCIVAVTEVLISIRAVFAVDDETDEPRPAGRVFPWAVLVVPVLPVVWVFMVHAKVVPDQIGAIADDTANGFVHIGPADPNVIPVYEAVQKYTGPNDVVVYFRARTMTLLTDRRAIQTTSIERVVDVGDWFAQKRDSDFFQPDLAMQTLEDLGFELVWSDPTWLLWRVP